MKKRYSPLFFLSHINNKYGATKWASHKLLPPVDSSSQYHRITSTKRCCKFYISRSFPFLWLTSWATWSWELCFPPFTLHLRPHLSRTLTVTDASCPPRIQPFNTAASKSHCRGLTHLSAPSLLKNNLYRVRQNGPTDQMSSLLQEIQTG